METSNVLGDLLLKRFQVDFIAQSQQLSAPIYNRLRDGWACLFNNVYWTYHWAYTETELEPHKIPIYNHHCGSKGGRYRISKKGTCYKCKKMIGSYKKLDTIRGLKALTEKEESDPYRDAIYQAFGISHPNSIKITNAKT